MQTYEHFTLFSFSSSSLSSRSLISVHGSSKKNQKVKKKIWQKIEKEIAPLNFSSLWASGSDDGFASLLRFSRVIL